LKSLVAKTHSNNGQHWIKKLTNKQTGHGFETPRQHWLKKLTNQQTGHGFKLHALAQNIQSLNYPRW